MMHVLSTTAGALGVWAYALVPLLVSMTGGYAHMYSYADVGGLGNPPLWNLQYLAAPTPSIPRTTTMASLSHSICCIYSKGAASQAIEKLPYCVRARYPDRPRRVVVR